MDKKNTKKKKAGTSSAKSTKSTASVKSTASAKSIAVAAVRKEITKREARKLMVLKKKEEKARAKAVAEAKAAEKQKAEKQVKLIKKRVAKQTLAKIRAVQKSDLKRIGSILRSNARRVHTKIKEADKRERRVVQGRRLKAKAKPATVKRLTRKELIRQVGDRVYSVRERVLYGIANGDYRFQWASLSKELGYGPGERRQMLSMLSNKGYTVESLAHHLWEENDGKGPGTDTIRDTIIDVLGEVSNPTQAFNKLAGLQDVPF